MIVCMCDVGRPETVEDVDKNWLLKRRACDRATEPAAMARWLIVDEVVVLLLVVRLGAS